jgi:hypothetical protein
MFGVSDGRKRGLWALLANPIANSAETKMCFIVIRIWFHCSKPKHSILDLQQ